MIVFYRYHLATRICPFFPVFSMGSEQRQNLYIGIIANFPLMEGRAGEPSSHAPNGGNDSPFQTYVPKQRESEPMLGYDSFVLAAAVFIR